MRRHTKLGARPNAVVVTRDTRVVPMDLWPVTRDVFQVQADDLMPFLRPAR